MPRNPFFHRRSNKTSDGVVVNEGMTMLNSVLCQASKRMMSSMTPGMSCTYLASDKLVRRQAKSHERI